MSRIALGYAARLAGRELRGGGHGLAVLVACLVLGVAAVAGIGSLSASLRAAIAGDARALLGGDVEARLAYRPASAAEHEFLARSGRLSEIAGLRAMARTADGRRQSLIELKAVDRDYPLYGAVAVSPPQPLAAALEARNGVFGAVVDAALLTRLGLAVGAPIRIGEARFEVRGTIAREPDAATSGLVFGPRVMIALAALAETRLIQPGALVNYGYRLRLPPGIAPAAWIAAANAAFPEAGWQLRSFTRASPELQRLLDRVGLFLSLIGLATLLVGGVGIANATRAYIAAKTPTIATLKCLGAPRRLVFLVYGCEIAALAALAIGAGLAIGALVPRAATPLLAHLLPVAARAGIYIRPLAWAALYGVLTTAAFSLWPLAATGRISAAALFRHRVEPMRPRTAVTMVAASLGLAAVLAAVVVAGAEDRRVASWFVAGAALAFAVFGAAGVAVRLGAGRLGAGRLSRRGWLLLRLALANLHRPDAPTVPAVLSLGIALTLLAAVALVEANLRRELDEQMPQAVPAVFLIDIQPAQLAGIAAIVRGLPGARIEAVPMMRGRITRLNGVPVERAAVAPAARWALRSDRGLTYAASMPKGSRLVAGTWWPPDYHGPPLISFDAALAEGMGLKLGDTLTVNLLGRDITARIANLRRIDWERLGINFAIVFAPGTLEHAPQSMLAAVHVPPDAEESLVGRVTEQYPNVSAINVREALAAVGRVVRLIAAAVRLTGLLTLAAGALVLSGAIAAGHRRRVYDAVVLKVLGATRGALLSGLLVEHALLGGLAGVIAGGLGTLAAYFVLTRLMNAAWVFLPLPMVATVAGAALLSAVLGLAGTWRALGVAAAPFLRNE